MLVFHMFPFSAFGGYDMLVLTIMDILGDLPKEWITRWEGIQQAAEVPEPLDPESTLLHISRIDHSPCNLCALAECTQRMQTSVR